MTDTQTFDVTQHGATGTADDAPGIAAAFKAACAASANGAPSTVLLPPGKTFNVASSVMMDAFRSNDRWDLGHNGPSTAATVHRKGVVTFQGTGATIKYVDLHKRFCWLQAPMVDGQTFGLIDIVGLTVDDNRRVPAGDCGGLIFGWDKGNWANIGISGCKESGIPPNPNAGKKGFRGCNPVSPVLFYGSGEAPGAYTQDILIQDCDLTAQGTLTSFYGTYNRVIDMIDQTDCIFDSGNAGASSSMIGNGAIIWRCSFENLDCSNSEDDGIEVDAASEVDIRGCDFHAIGEPICLTRVGTVQSCGHPYLTDTPPQINVQDCTYSGALNVYWANSGLRQPLMDMHSNLPGHAYPTPPNWGDVRYSNVHLTWTSKGGLALAPFTFSGPLNSVTIEDCSTQGAKVVSIHNTAGTIPVTLHQVFAAGVLQTAANHPGVVTSGCKVTYS